MISYAVLSLVLHQTKQQPQPKPRPAAVIPRMIDVQREKRNWYSIYVVFPMFPESSTVAKIANSEAEGIASTILADFQEKIILLNSKPATPYFINLKPTISLTNQSLISFAYYGQIEDGLGKTRQFCRTVNVAAIKGKPKVLALGDLFSPRDLESIKAMMREQSKMTFRYSPNEDDIHKFIFSKASLCWLIPDRAKKGEYKTLKFDWKYIKPLLRDASILDSLH